MIQFLLDDEYIQTYQPQGRKTRKLLSKANPAANDGAAGRAWRREQLRAWMKTTPRQRLAWLEEAQQLVAATKNKKPNP